MAAQKRGLQSVFLRIFERIFYFLAKSYIAFKKPVLVVVAGSVGKTSTKLTVAQILASEKRVSYMNESYNSGIGLPLSVFELKAPKHTTNPIAWKWRIARACFKFFRPGPEIMVLEYGIDHPGEMDKFIAMAKPDVVMMTAIKPEHMEYLKTIETVAKEEMKVVKSSLRFSVLNQDDIEPRFIPNQDNLIFYGANSQNSYKIKEINQLGALVDFNAGDKAIRDIRLQLIAEPLISHTAGAVALAFELGLTSKGITRALKNLESTPGRNRLLKGINGSWLIDDTVNFSPEAGVVALKTLRDFKAKRRVAVLGNMHELGEFEQQGFDDVAKHFYGVDAFVFIGPLAKKYFTPQALKKGFELNKDLFEFEDAISAGKFLQGFLKKGDVALFKGPFGGFYIEETVKLVLDDIKDARKLVRQYEYWPVKKQAAFGDDFIKVD